MCVILMNLLAHLLYGYRTEPVKFGRQEFDEEIVKRYLPHSRLSSGLLVVDESTYETIRQKSVAFLFSYEKRSKG